MNAQTTSLLYIRYTCSASRRPKRLVFGQNQKKEVCYVSASTPSRARLPKGQTSNSGSSSGKIAPGARKSPILPALPVVKRTSERRFDVEVKYRRPNYQDGYTLAVPVLVETHTTTAVYGSSIHLVQVREAMKQLVMRRCS